MAKLLAYEYQFHAARVFLQLESGNHANILMVDENVYTVSNNLMDSQQRQLLEMAQYCRWKHYMLLFQKVPARGLCSICRVDIHSVASKMLCGHVFHRNCIVEWFKKKNECPLCRRELFPQTIAEKCLCVYGKFQECKMFKLDSHKCIV